jgi:hypothetical protein
MRSVQAAVAAPLRWRPGAATAVAALAALGLWAGVTSNHDVARPSVERPAPPVALIGGVPIQQARCAQWNAGGIAERDAVVAALASSVGGASTSGGHGTTLMRTEAYALFNRACASPIAHGFLLYELYIRAAGFRSLGGAQT